MELMGDPDRVFLMDGIRNGFRIIDKGAIPSPATMNNYKSATDPTIKSKVEAQILTEIQEGRYVVSETRPTLVSALGAYHPCRLCSR